MSLETTILYPGGKLILSMSCTAHVGIETLKVKAALHYKPPSPPRPIVSTSIRKNALRAETVHIVFVERMFMEIL